MAYYLTADGGTESIRARVYDVRGVCLGTEAVAYKTNFTPGQAEQNPADWWSSFVKAANLAMDKSGVPRQEIEAIAYATTCCSVVALDKNGEPLRPCLLWMDVRAYREAEEILASGDDALKLNGNGIGPISAEWMLPKSLWLKRNEPQLFEKAYRICEYQDFMTFHLTGEWAASLDNAGLRWHYRNREGGWPKSLLKKINLEELLDKWPQRVVAPGEVVATLSKKASLELGLSSTTKVVQGGADALIGMIGLGVYRPGQLAMITGSSHLQFGVTSEPIHSKGVWGAYADIVYPDRYIVEGGQTSTGSIINWLSRLVGAPLDFETLNKKASELKPGSEGLIVQDHFQGNRTPHTDPLSRGAIVGLTLAHEQHHIFRAIMEGISFGTRSILDSFKNAGYLGQELTVGGGAASSPLWLQIHADTSGLPVRVPESQDAPSTGSAVLAAVGNGDYSSIDEGIEAMIRPGRTIDPIPENVKLYEEIYPKYTALYRPLREILETKK